MEIVIEGVDLPGRRCAGPGEPAAYENVHVGIRHGNEVLDLVSGGADTASWTAHVRVVVEDAGIDYRGPYVQGKRGDRHLALRWGTVEGTHFELFRGAKLRLDLIEPAIVRNADRTGWRLRGTLGLTDACGMPRCASVKPPDILWTAERTLGASTSDRST